MKDISLGHQIRPGELISYSLLNIRLNKFTYVIFSAIYQERHQLNLFSLFTMKVWFSFSADFLLFGVELTLILGIVKPLFLDT